MKRILVTDDERPVIESISLIVKRELAGEFEVAGFAMNGREAIEKASALAPDIILMDVRMPGLSGLDAIREIRKRGSAAAFILVTAYERFEIAREAVELGIIDYLLKPVSREKLASALRNASAVLERRGEAERREIEHRDREETMRSFVETALLHGVMLGEALEDEASKYRVVLGLEDDHAVAGAVLFLPPAGSVDPAAELRTLHERFRSTIRYKTKALAGPLVGGQCAVLLPVRDPGAALEAVEALRGAIQLAHGSELERDFLRIGFGRPRPLAQAGLSWSEALREALGGRSAGRPAEERPFEPDEAFLECLAEGSLERARLALAQVLERAQGQPVGRYRLVALFGAACRLLCRRGLLPGDEAAELLDGEDLRLASTDTALERAARARFDLLAERIGRAPQWSPLVARAVAFVREHYDKPMSLESTAYELGISPNRLSRVFSEETGRGFSDYLIEFRIGKAKELLLQPGASIKQVSISCGYPDPNYFSRLFKKITGLTPTAFSSGTPEAGDE